MNKTKIPLTILMFVLCSCAAQDGKKHCNIAFYNVENLFDTVDEPGKNDNEFTPKGGYRYTEKVYNQKLHNIATVIGKIDAVVVGLAEIENNTVLEDLVSQPELKQHHYKYVWYDSPDPRGIDLALLYDNKRFKPITSRALPVQQKGLATRDVLYVCGILGGDTVHILVNHWPSRAEGVKVSEPKRVAAAEVNKRITDSLLLGNSKSKIIIMGDLNDNPDDLSVTTTLGTESKASYLNNPWTSGYRNGKGTSVYHRQWDHFDQIILSTSWKNNTSGWHFERAEIFDADFIRNTKYEDAYPLRSFRGKNWVNGYSDHLPVFIRISK